MATPTVVTNGALLLRLRKDRELSQRDSAAMLGITQQAWSRLENGAPTRRTTLLAIAYVYGLAHEELPQLQRAA